MVAVDSGLVSGHPLAAGRTYAGRVHRDVVRMSVDPTAVVVDERLRSFCSQNGAKSTRGVVHVLDEGHGMGIGPGPGHAGVSVGQEDESRDPKVFTGGLELA